MRRKPAAISLADRARDAGQWELAAQLYRRALDQDPDNPPIWVQYGHAVKESGELRDPDKLAQAELAYRRAVALDPGAADSYLQLGHVLKLQGKTSEAEAAYLRAFVVAPSMPYPVRELSGLGWSHAMLAELQGLIVDQPSRGGAPGVGGDGQVPMPEPANSAEHSRDYAEWVRLYDTINDDDRRAIARAIGEMNDPPLISVVMPVYETPEVYLRTAIDSVRQQLYPHWELCIADDASTSPHVKHILEYYCSIDAHIKVCYRSKNGHIAAASNSALALAEGSFVALLDHDDVLPEHALYIVAAALEADPEIDLMYSDEDKIDANGRRYDAYFKSDWNADLMLSQNMFSHLGVYRRSLIEKLGGFRCGYEGSQDYDLVLRAQPLTTADRIRHLPHILYHWRAVSGSTALESEMKPYALVNARRAVADHLAESRIIAEVLASPHPAFNRVRYSLPKPAPRVTIVIPTRDRVDLLSKCIQGLLYRTGYPDIEILIIDNQSKDPETQAYYNQLHEDPRIRILFCDGPFNYSAINKFVITQATGLLLCLLSSGIEVIADDWLTEMVSQALRPRVGAVGALLYDAEGRIQHGGIIVGFSGIAGHAYRGLARGDFGYFGRGAVVQNVSAVTGACLVILRAVFNEIGGFNEKDLPTEYSDVDLCLRLREVGYRIVWTPHAELYYHGADRRNPDTDPDPLGRVSAAAGYMLSRWGNIVERDPYYNPNLRLDGTAFDLAFPPRVDWPWRRYPSGNLPIASSGDAQLIAKSGLFDPAWYRAQNPDVAAGMDPLAHYRATGSAQGRHPNPLFDSAWYRAQNPDVVAAGMEPLVHYIVAGSAEGRRPNPLFNPSWYRAQNPDVVAAGMEPLAHYLATGSAEGRRPNSQFDPAWYRAQNPDVVAAGTEPLAHYLAVGSAERRPPCPEGPTVRPDVHVPDLFELRRLKPRGRIAVVLHLFDPDLWSEMREAIGRILHPFDLFVSLVKGSSEHMRTLIIRAFPYVHVFDFENHGRDIGPFLVFLQSGVLFRYDLVCKLHAKRSPYYREDPRRKYEDGAVWRRALIDGVLGSSSLVDRIISSFRSDADLGMVVADGNIYRGYDRWTLNETLLAELLPRVGISPDVKDRSFPGGSIFWIRSLLLRTLAGLGLQLNEFEAEPLKVDGGLGHAVERIFGLICEDAGMRVVESGQLAETARQPARRMAKVHPIALYLPQFHPVRENDEWWGAGFTEWANITRAKPLFRGHRQPRLPSDLGFYDLRLSEAREAQAVLARRYGIAAFCYYYYWFNGRRILERPLDEVLASGRPDFPFMICWANEPWTRNWDGLTSDVLLPQTYERGWTSRFAHEIGPLLRDQRYFGLNGSPMLLIYRIGHIPDAAFAMRELRGALSREGISDVHLAATWVWFPDDGDLPADPSILGLDAYYEFPPHMVPAQPLQPLPLGLPEGFLRDLHDYNRTVTAALAKLNEPVIGRRHRGVMAGFDNTPRKGTNGHVYHGATPTNFRRWLRGTMLRESHQVGERVVFINAWNEWAEGTSIEPDREFGCGWLEAVASAAEVDWSKTQE